MSVIQFPATTTVEAYRGILVYSRISELIVLANYGSDAEVRDHAESQGYTVSDCSDGIAKQEAAVRAWAGQQGFGIVGYARDDGISARIAAENRNGLHAALEVIRDPDVAGIGVMRLDRLARDVEPMLDTIEQIWDTDSDVFATDLGRIPRGKRGREVAIQAAMRGKTELDATLERLHRGKLEAAARGEYPGGKPLERKFGYHLIAKPRGGWRWQPDAAEQAIIARMCAECPSGRGYTAMARKLNAEGVPTVTGAPWSATTVRANVLRRSESLVLLRPTSLMLSEVGTSLTTTSAVGGLA